MRALVPTICLTAFYVFALLAPTYAQDQAEETPTDSAAQAASSDDEAPLAAPSEVGIEPQANDDEIAERLTSILTATTWFESPRVNVDQGVVFLTGSTRKEEYKTWAGDLARNTQDVAAVVNRISVIERPVWDLNPVWSEVRKLQREAVQLLPLLTLAIVILIATWFTTRWASFMAASIFKRRFNSRLLVSVVSRSVAIPVFLLGLYLALRVSGLTQIAATVLGGTGLLGLIIGIAFRDIAENFLASVLISIQRPFALGDQIAVDGHEGIVQSVTARGTLLMTLDGNHVQIPNASIYKSVIRNVTANPNIRSSFVVGIDYGDSISRAQSTILQVLLEHHAVLENPAPMILVDELGPSTVNLRVYFWLDGHAHSPLKVRSSVIRLVKVAIEEAGLTMPDESREVIFPKGVPVHMLSDDGLPAPPRKENSKVDRAIPDANKQEVSRAEDGLNSENSVIREQARNSRSPEQGDNLLED